MYPNAYKSYVIDAIHKALHGTKKGQRLLWNAQRAAQKLREDSMKLYWSPPVPHTPKKQLDRWNASITRYRTWLEEHTQRLLSLAEAHEEKTLQREFGIFVGRSIMARQQEYEANAPTWQAPMFSDLEDPFSATL